LLRRQLFLVLLLSSTLATVGAARETDADPVHCGDLLGLAVTRHQPYAELFNFTLGLLVAADQVRHAKSLREPLLPEDAAVVAAHFDALAAAFDGSVKVTAERRWFDVEPAAPAPEAEIGARTDSLRAVTDATSPTEVVTRAARVLAAQGRAFRVVVAPPLKNVEPQLRLELLGRGHPADERLARLMATVGYPFGFDCWTMRKGGADAFIIEHDRIGLPEDYIWAPSLTNLSVLHEAGHAFNCWRVLKGDASVQKGEMIAREGESLPGRYRGIPGSYRGNQSNDESDVQFRNVKNEILALMTTADDSPDLFFNLVGRLEVVIRVSGRNAVVAKHVLDRLPTRLRVAPDGTLWGPLSRGAMVITREDRALKVKVRMNHRGRYDWEFTIATNAPTDPDNVLAVVADELRRRRRVNIQRIYQGQLGLKALSRALSADTETEQRALLRALNRSLRHRRTSFREPDFPIEDPRALATRFNHELAEYLRRANQIAPNDP
jgi:hypothetical protein